MLKNLIEAKKEKPLLFQVVLLNNDSSQNVVVQEARQVDFQRVREHLKLGDSVFITSKGSQKLNLPKVRTECRNKNHAGVAALYFSHVRNA
jgi:hypothetical protein